MKRLAVIFVVSVLSVASWRPVWARSAQDVFSQAGDAYLQGHYEQAARLYEECLSDYGLSNEHLYYNLGNAYFKQGKLGPAIYNYERALKIAPDMEDARFNLKVARQAAKALGKHDLVVGAQADPFWIRAVTYFSPGTLAALFLVSWFLLLGLLASLLYLRDGVWRVVVFSVGCLMVVSTILFGLLLSGRAYYDKNWKEGVVLADVVEVREGPRENAKSSFSVHAGLKVRIVESDVEWYKIRLKNGLEGWVKKRRMGLL